MPEGKDPDEVLRDSPDCWREEVRTAQPIVEYSSIPREDV
jgi:hypothetical protein